MTSPTTSSTSEQSKRGIAAFVSALATYYMDFLETDFRKRRVPKRSVRFRNNKNLRIGLALDKYAEFQSSVLKVLEAGMNRPLIVPKGKYRAAVSQTLHDIIKARTKRISDDVLTDVAESIAAKMLEVMQPEAVNIADALSRSQDFAYETIRSRVVIPFVTDVEGLLQGNAGADLESLYSLEEGLTAVLTEPLEDLISEYVTSAQNEDQENVSERIAEVLDGSSVRGSIEYYFHDYSLNDLFSEIKELVDNNLILDKQELYLYFCDIQFNKNTYPIFYVPLTITKVEASFQVACDPSVYVNKRAIEYIVQEFNKERGQHGTIQSIAERIIYPQEDRSSMLELLGNILSDILDYFRVSPEIDLLDSTYQDAPGLAVTISNSMYVCIFDKADEALVNDYEELLALMRSTDVPLIDRFTGLISSFVCSSPKSLKREISDEWDGTELNEKLVFDSPIPLNPEQRQILLALDKPDCKFIAVEGPPGTGKSHTITAIAFRSILRHQSVLVLSDKKEALDVVEEKITDVMNRVRVSDDFQNPILRLGKSANNYAKILSAPSLNKIRSNVRAVKSQEAEIDSELRRIHEYLTTNIDATVAGYSNVEIADIHTLVTHEKKYQNGKAYPFEFEEALESENGIEHLDEARSAMTALTKTLSYSFDNVTMLNLFESVCPLNRDVDSFSKFLSFVGGVQDLRATCQDRSFLKRFRTLTTPHLTALNSYIGEYRELGSGLFRYFLKGKRVAELSRNMNAILALSFPLDIREDLEDLERASAFSGDVYVGLKERGLTSFLDDPLPIVHGLMLADEYLLDDIDLESLSTALNETLIYLERYPRSAKKMGLSSTDLRTLLANDLSALSEEVFSDALSHLFLHRKLSIAFENIPAFDYSGGLLANQELLTSRMTHILDKRVLDFCDNDQATAKTLRGIIKKKQRFPRDEFSKLREAFPCIVAGIRDYAEFIPLEPEIFDVVIIDEASQVSIAQALPALLRAKKVVVLGDKKQFSNVKTAQARSDMNRDYLTRLNTSFRENVASGPAELERLTKFDIKTSILEFFEFICNFSIMLRKHFRGYRELISYSSKHFYDGDLQAIRIRGKSIDETIKFSVIEHDGRQELAKNTNCLERDLILNELRQLKARNGQVSVGIITPHTNQQKLIAAAVSEDLDRDYFYEKLKLKIMTFDTCQGEERDIILFSMVASPVDDKLWAVFIKDLESVDLEEGGQIKAQRLNVGFSRSKECMHFVLSKPVEAFKGAIGQALRHYSVVLKEAPLLPSPTDVDRRSPMESRVLEWLKNTPFFQRNHESIELKAQFQIGDYLKQLDQYYDHPAYRVDFLLLFRDAEGRSHDIIVEYDGFNEHCGHFSDTAQVNELNYENYYTAEHVEREKILEGYGYKFLRINRFNLGKDPVATLNERLSDLTRPRPRLRVARVVDRLVISQEAGQAKQCPRCGRLLPIDSFADSRLTTGVGRICSDCKARSLTRQAPARKASDLAAERDARSRKLCPKCGSRMVRRRGAYGAFYGCTTFPQCRGTRRI